MSFLEIFHTAYLLFLLSSFQYIGTYFFSITGGGCGGGGGGGGGGGVISQCLPRMCLTYSAYIFSKADNKVCIKC